MIQLHCGNSLDVLATLGDDSVDSIVTDPPYGFGNGKRAGFMGKQWDYDVPSVDIWVECLRVLKPGGHLLAFAGTRTQHRMCVNIEDAGFEIRDMIAWVYGSGFPKSMNVSKAIDKRGGNVGLTAEIGLAIKQARLKRGLSAAACDQLFCGGTTNWSWFEGRPKGQRAPTPETFDSIAKAWPELEPLKAAVAEAEREVVGQQEMRDTSEVRIAVTANADDYDASARRVVDITTAHTPEAQQWEGWGTALKPALEPITVARKPFKGTVAANVLEHGTGALNIDGCRVGDSTGRWPSNLIHDGSDEVTQLFPHTTSGMPGVRRKPHTTNAMAGNLNTTGQVESGFGDSGSAARFFQQCKGDYDGVWQDLNLPPEPASTADSCLSQQRQAVASALVLAVSSVLPGGMQLSVSMEPSTNATGIELKTLEESVTQAILNIAPRFWQESKHERLSLTISPVSVVVQKEPTGTTTITASHWKSDGSAEPVTYNITPNNLELGEKDSVARFKYCAKANKKDREEGNTHPTVKPTALMTYLVRLITPPGGVVLDPFMGSGSTGKAAVREGFDFIGIEREEEYVAIASKRLQVIQRSILASSSADQNG